MMKSTKTVLSNGTGNNDNAVKSSPGGSPAKRPTTFVNMSKLSSLSVKYNGLAANRTIQAKRLEAQASIAGVSAKSHQQTKPEENSHSSNGKATTSPCPVSNTKVPPTDVKSKDEAQSDSARHQNQVEPGKDNEKGQEGMTKEPEEQKKKEKVEHLSLEEIEEKSTERLKKIKDKCDQLKTVKARDEDTEGSPFSHDFRQIVLVLAKSYFFFKQGEVPFSEIRKFRHKVADQLCEDHVIDTILDVLVDAMKRKDFLTDQGKGIQSHWLPVKNILLTLMNYSDFVDQVKFSIVEHKGAVPIFLETLERYHDGHMNKTITGDEEKLVKQCLSILHNCGSLEENVSRLRDLGTIPTIISYIDSHSSQVRLTTIATVAGLVNESEAELLGKHQHIFSHLLEKLKRSLKCVSHRDNGWSAEELTRAVRQLARNDANKAILVDKGCLPLLLKTIEKGNENELEEALHCLWTLSFDDSNKPRMLAEPGLIQAISDKYHTVSGSTRHKCHGILWSLRETLLQDDQFKSIAEEILSLKSEASPKAEVKAVTESVDELSAGLPVKGHVMISYQWGNQEVIKRITAELRAHNIPVWIDIDYMGGSTLQAMAQAVEDSFVVVIAMSQRYKDSPNTRAEAEYAFQQRKPIVPLIMQNGYRPDGWLGLILGSKLFYDFSGKYSFESRMDGVLKAIFAITSAKDGVDIQPLVATKAGAAALTSPSSLAPPPVTAAPPPSRSAQAQRLKEIDEQRVRNWTPEDVTKWLAKFGLESCETMKDLGGEEIVFLHNVRHEAPEFFYVCLEKKLHLSSLLDLAKATKAFGDLSLKT